ncbi:MAG TPA: M23 family metallopeptidase, partial [Leptolinea sp.]
MKQSLSSKSGLPRWLLTLLIGILFLLALGSAYLAYQIFFSEPSAEQVFPKYAQPKDLATAQLEEALQVAMQRHPDVLAYFMYRVAITNVAYSEDKNTAILWLALYDKDTDTLVPSESGLAIATRNPDNTWAVTVQADTGYNTLLQQLPAAMIDEETRAQYLSAPQALSKGIAPLHGYHLPWKKGVTKFLTGSLGHVLTYKSCPSSCLYAFDFADGGSFPILAAKGGRVKYAVWKFPDNNHTNANYIILEDDSTSPVTFQVYFHLSQDSIPAELRIPGTWVNQGQFIGNVDNTGYSSGPHLHFHVHANPTSFWGNSVDIVFEEVAVNGGRPRTCTEAKAFPSYGSECMPSDKYTSNNGDSKPPTGVLSAPIANTLVTTSTVAINGFGSDESGVAKIQPMVKYDGIWRRAGEAITTSAFVTDLDLCAAGVPDGPLSIGLNIWDNGGNKTVSPIGEVSIRKQHTCPANPPACSPAANQAALYNNANYQGYCRLIDPGDIPDLASLTDFGDNNLESIQLGGGVSAMLFDGVNFSGRNQTINASSDDLDMQLIGANRVSSLKLVNILPVPAIPLLNAVTGPNNSGATADNSIILSWQPSIGALEYHAELKGPDGFSAIQDWQTSTAYSVGTLKPGSYQWKVFARNSAGENSAASSFEVQPGNTETLTPIASPYEAGFTENTAGWTSSGSWQRIGFKIESENLTGWVFGNATSFA